MEKRMYREWQPGAPVLDYVEFMEAYDSDAAYMIYLQPFLREAMTYLEAFKACSLPKCRRAKRCSGCHPYEAFLSNRLIRFPPCVSSNEDHARMLKALTRNQEGAA